MHNLHITVLAKNYMVSLHVEFTLVDYFHGCPNVRQDSNNLTLTLLSMSTDISFHDTLIVRHERQTDTPLT